MAAPTDLGPVTFIEFVTHTLGLRLTRPQLVLAAVCFDGVEPKQLRGADRDIAKKLFGDVAKFPSSARSMVALVKGARAGGSWIAALYLLYRAITADTSMLAPGEIGVALAVAPDQRLARLLIRYAVGAAKSVPSIAALIATEGADGFTLRRADGTTVSVEALPASRGGASLRGRTLLCAVLDESNFFRDESGAYEVTDRVILDAVLPRVVPGGLVVMLSTPFTEAGVLFELFKSEHGKPRTALVAHAPTLLLRDDAHTRALVDRERQRDPKNCAREFDALFVSPTAALVSWAEIEKCVNAAQRLGVSTDTSGATEGAWGLDVGLRRDRTAFVRCRRELRSRGAAPPLDLLIVDLVKVLKPGFGASVNPLARVTMDDIESVAVKLHKRAPGTFHHDPHYGDEIRSRLGRRHIKTEEAKMHAAAQEKRAALFAARVEAGTIILPDDRDLLDELKQIRITRHAGGRTTIAAPNRKGAHDDVVDAMLLAVEAASKLMPGGDVKCETRITRNGPCVGAVNSFFTEHRDPRTGNVHRIPCPPPMGTPMFDAWAEEKIAQGISTPEIEAWLRERNRADDD